MTTKAEVKQEILANMEMVRGLRHGLRVADVVFAMDVMPEIATAALVELVGDGALVVAGKAGRVNVYGAAPSAA